MGLILRALAVWAAITVPAVAQDFVGDAVAVDGDKIRIGGQVILIYGIDSIDRQQRFCADGRQMWDCYSVTVREMEILVDQGPATCTKVGEDRYRSPIARCEVGGRDLGLAMVEAGMAFAFRIETDEYVAAEEAAEAAGAGLWTTGFIYPWEFRSAGEGNPEER